ncbi:uncharacterized protein M437DRAFT_50475, partial [Aureobasidium melanogenum CBS 110374]
IDIIYMPISFGASYLIIAREGLSSYLEARALRDPTSKLVAKFLYEEVIYRYSYFYKLVINGGPKNTGYTYDLTKDYSIKRILILLYYL